MKVILSRKGFDSSNGGCPSPIMPDGTLLSMPIPSNDYKDKYSDLEYKGTKYSDLLNQLKPRNGLKYCHVDPDIRDNRIRKIPGWIPAFGQISSAQGKLINAGVEKGDIFLFFGWFRKVELIDGKYRFIPHSKGDFYDHADLHVLYGYMQIGDVYDSISDFSKFKWHPHASYVSEPNAIYTATKTLSLKPSLPGVGTFEYRKNRVLTMENCNRGTWIPYPFLMPEYISDKRKNSSKDGGLYYSGIWQELVVYESEGLMDWVKSVIM